MKLDQLLSYCLQYSDGEIRARTADGRAIQRSYRSFHDDVRNLARRLKRSGLNETHRVGILSANCYEWLVWDIALAHVGATLMAFPDDDRRPHARLREQYGLSLLVVARRAASGSSYVVEMGRALSDRPMTIDAEISPARDPDCYSLVFSSGTSGYLKGLKISKAGTEFLIEEFSDAYPTRVNERLLIFLPLSNYQQRMLFYWCLYRGLCVQLSSMEYLFADARSFRPTFLIAPPGLYDNVRNMSARAANPRARIATFLGAELRFLITGMAPISRATLSYYWENGLPLYEVYGVVECGMIAWNTNGAHKLGTVGRPIDPGSVELGSDEEVVVTRERLLTNGYFECREGDEGATFLSANTVATGDIGFLDEDGYLVLEGRKKEVIVTAGGRKFHPNEAEQLIAEHELVRDVAVFGDYRGTGITAVVCTDAACDREGEAAIHGFVERVNQLLEPYKRIAKVVLTKDAFSIHDGTLTRNMKKDRTGIRRKYGGSRR